jgi:hypothetical protein
MKLLPRQGTVKILLSLLSEKAIKKDGRPENLFSVIYSTQEPQLNNLAVFMIKEYSQSRSKTVFNSIQ